VSSRIRCLLYDVGIKITARVLYAHHGYKATVYATAVYIYMLDNYDTVHSLQRVTQGFARRCAKFERMKN